MCLFLWGTAPDHPPEGGPSAGRGRNPSALSLQDSSHVLKFRVGARLMEESSLSPRGQALAAWLAADPSLPATMSLRQIGATLGLSRERVRQLLKRFGVLPKRRGRLRTARPPVSQDDPGYAAYARALSRGAPESVAKARASVARWWYAKGREKWLARYYGDEEYRAELLRADRERRRARYRGDADYRAKRLEASRLAYGRKRRTRKTEE